MHSLKSWLDVPLSNRSERAASVSTNFSSLLFLIVMFTHLIKILSMAGGQVDKKWEHLPKSTTDEHLQVKTRITLVPKSYGRITGIKRTVTFGHFELLASKELLLVSRAGYQPCFFFPHLILFCLKYCPSLLTLFSFSSHWIQCSDSDAAHGPVCATQNTADIPSAHQWENYMSKTAWGTWLLQNANSNI